MSAALQLLSTQDWTFQVTATDSTGAPFDMTAYDLRCQFRTAPAAPPIDDCSTGNGKVARSSVPNVVSVTSHAIGRDFAPTTRAVVIADLMGTNGAATILISRFTFIVDPGVTHA